MVIKSCPLLMKDTETCVGSSLALYFVLFSLLSLVSFYFVFISLISFRFVSFLLISFRFRWFRFVSFLFRFALYRYPNLRRFFSIFEVRGGNFFLNVVWLKYDHFFIAKLIICFIWIKKITLLIVKLKNCSCVFMSSAWTNTWGSLCQSFCLFYTQALVARTTPLFLTFCLQTYFQ
jgi:hypothetical protein